MKNNNKQVLAGVLLLPVMVLGASLFTATMQPVSVAHAVVSQGAQEEISTNNGILFVLGAIAIIMIVAGSVYYVTNKSKSGSTKYTKNVILFAAIGIIVALLAYAVVNFAIGNLSSSN